MSLPGAPKAAWLPVQLWRWLRWVGWFGWRSTVTAVWRRGPAVRDREGIGLGLQTFRVLRLTLGACVPARDVYRFRLYRSGGNRRLWQYVFDQETNAFHRWRDGDTGGSTRARELLRDKHALLEMLGASGIPVASTLLLAPRGPADLERLLDRHPALFCKPRRGSRSHGAFIVERGESTLQVRRLGDHAALPLDAATRFLHQTLGAEEYLVQPNYATHPALAVLTDSRDAITLRMITEGPKRGPFCSSAVLEIPVGGEPRGTHVLLPVDLQTGGILRWPDEDLPRSVMENYRQVYERMRPLDLSVLPDCNRLREAGLSAHRHVPELYAVAWDFVIGWEGPLLLEGNAGWRCSTVQLLYGGMLSAATLTPCATGVGAPIFQAKWPI